MTNNEKEQKETQTTQEEQMSEEERKGYHKGCLETLSKERMELAKIVGIVEQLMQLHVGQLKELGVDIQEQAQQAAGTSDKAPEKRKPIEDIL